nr:MAG TPA: hypothetical protein [Caudoviricetes sp.]DAG55303.1 MAG TPA: hypothetical protein [Caudoviricetes sp.]
MSCQTSEVAATMSAPTEIQKARRAYLILDSFTLLSSCLSASLFPISSRAWPQSA